MNPQITKLTRADERKLSGINELLPQLNPNIPKLSLVELTTIVDSPANTIYVAVKSDGSIVGMLLVVTVHQFAGIKCWIEDVVVSQDHRGQGIARRLVEAAISEVPESTRFINLTSNPRREAAHHLYTSLGFEPRDTVVFRRTLTRNVVNEEK